MSHAKTVFKTIGLVGAFVVPLLLIPSSGNAHPKQNEWGFLDHVIKVRHNDRGAYRKQGQGDNLRRLFDGAAPQSMSKSRKRSFGRSGRNRRDYRAMRKGRYAYDIYDDEAVTCATPRQIHRRLLRQGWGQFHNLRIRPRVLAFKARQRHQGRASRDLTYNLRIDRCSGALLKAQLQWSDRWFIRWIRRLSWNR